MLREQLIVHGIKWLAGGIDRERDSDLKRLAKNRLRDNAGIALKHRTRNSLHRDGAGGV